uniref:Trafficking protein, kinesin binding 1a n=1 Tax=Hucho hucho TaxID=62062 RepID=A0A4W5NCE5_9TELE
MTKTYNDIDAVTRLLEEKERDLELAARIGQSLLKKNRTLTEQNDYMEVQVGHITEEVAQLHHELNLKDELLQFYTNASEESEEDSTTGSPTSKRSKLLGVSGFGSDSMQRKLRELEEENLSLRSEACNLKTETETYEEKEQQLVNDCVKELRQSSLQINTIAEELARKTEDAMRQQEEITHLLSQIVDLQKKAKSYAVENEELSQHLGAAKDAQRQLTVELTDLDDKYSECIEMLHEAQEELKYLRNRNHPAGTPRRFHPLGLYPMDSLAAEIEGTMRKEMSLDDPECEEQKVHHKRVFETVKNINQMVRQRSPIPSNANIPGSNQASSLSSAHSSGKTTPMAGSISWDVRGDGVTLDNRQQSMLMESAADNQDSVDARAKKAAGVQDLRLALRRLSLRRQNNLSERRFFEEERGRRRGGGGVVQDGGGQGGGMTPSDSIMSLGSLHLWASRPYLPDKLQIVKPLEGEGEKERGMRGEEERRMGLGREREREKREGLAKPWERGREWQRKVERGSKVEREGEGEVRDGEKSGGERERGRRSWSRKRGLDRERERGRRWAREVKQGRETEEGMERGERPVSLMLFNSFWSLMHHHRKSGLSTSQHSYYRDPQPRGWLGIT